VPTSSLYLIAPSLFEKEHPMVVHRSFLIISGTLQNQDGVISVKAGWIDPFVFEQNEMPSHDFH
jgi:error-prone DNA polymerase